MPRFTTRVELHGAEESDYDLLHDEMEKRDFKKTITTQNDTELRLPSAEYNKESDDTIDDVLNAAKSAAGVVKTQRHLPRDASILVTQSAGRKWFNLDPV